MQSNIPGFSLAIVLWTVSMQLEHKNGVTNATANPLRSKCFVKLSNEKVAVDNSLFKRLLD